MFLIKKKNIKRTPNLATSYVVTPTNLSGASSPTRFKPADHHMKNNQANPSSNSSSYQNAIEHQ